MSIDWTNPKDKVSKYFTVRECLYLPQWDRLATEADGLTLEVKANLFRLANKIDVVREALGAPINVHCCFRPTAYNKLVGGAAKSSHVEGSAIDFSIKDKNCDDVRTIILNSKLLDTLELRMEDLKGANWIHLDTRTPGPSGKRFFKP